jgi:hypothetical protein
MIVLLAPLGLLALAALVLPVLLHLIRRSEQQELDFAALRWLSERNRPRQQLRLHDLVLLVLRLLLIALLALLLAMPARHLRGEPGAVWVLVSPDIDPAAARAALDKPLAEWRWLAPGFPPIDTPAPPIAALASLVREADSMLPPATALSLVVPQTLVDLDAGRLRLAHAVDWTPLPGRPAPPAVTVPAAPLRLAIRSIGPHEDERLVVRALAKAWQAGGREVVLDESDTPVPADTTLLFWLGGEPDAAAQSWIAGGGRAIASSIAKPQGVTVLSDDAGLPLLRDAALGRGHLFAFASALRPSALPSLLDPEFPKRLLAQVEAPAAVPTVAAASDVRPQKIDPAPRGPHRPLDRGFAIIAALLFLLERLWATRRREVPA